jgi:hypothetical protein
LFYRWIQGWRDKIICMRGLNTHITQIFKIITDKILTDTHAASKAAPATAEVTPTSTHLNITLCETELAIKCAKEE